MTRIPIDDENANETNPFTDDAPRDDERAGAGSEDGNAMPQRKGFMEKLKEVFKGEE